MALTVEDGTGVAGANSYVDLATVRAYMTDRGLSVTGVEVDSILSEILIRATDYLESKRLRYIGSKLYGDGHLQWPRIESDGLGVTVEGFTLAPTAIPNEIKLAQCQLVVDISEIDPLPVTTASAAIKRERVEGIAETEYAINNSSAPLPRFPKVDALLAPLFKGGGIPLTLTRI
jgi:hypothetical protein